MMYNMFKYYDYGLIDNLSITRDGNRLKKVTDQCDELTYAEAIDGLLGRSRWASGVHMGRQRQHDQRP